MSTASSETYKTTPVESLYVVLDNNLPLLYPNSELRESLSRVGSDLKQRIVDSVRSTWKTINEFALAHKTTPQELVDKQVNEVLSQMSADEQERLDENTCKCMHV